MFQVGNRVLWKNTNEIGVVLSLCLDPTAKRPPLFDVKFTWGVRSLPVHELQAVEAKKSEGPVAWAPVHEGGIGY